MAGPYSLPVRRFGAGRLLADGEARGPLMGGHSAGLFLVNLTNLTTAIKKLVRGFSYGFYFGRFNARHKRQINECYSRPFRDFFEERD